MKILLIIPFVIFYIYESKDNFSGSRIEEFDMTYYVKQDNKWNENLLSETGKNEYYKIQ